MDNKEILNRIFMITERLIIFDGIDDVFNHILKTSIALTGADAGTIRLFDIEDGNLKIVKGQGVTEEFLSQAPLRIGEGVIGKALEAGEVFVTTDISRENDCRYPELAKNNLIQAVLCVPMKNREKVIGCITVYKKNSDQFNEKDQILLSIFSTEAVEAVEKSRLINELQLNAQSDSLTGTLNKRSLFNQLDIELERSKRYKENLAVLFIDLDGFKDFNDRHGHLLGDKLLYDITRIFKKCCRKVDIIGRFGGDEFVVIAPNTGAGGAETLAKKICREVDAFRFFEENNDNFVKITCSIGVSLYAGEAIGSSDLLQMADRAMYDSKKSGKNCVTMGEFN